MRRLLKGGEKSEQVSRFCDGSTLGVVAKENFRIIQESKADIVSVSEGKISTTILNLYEEGIPVEPSGALSVAGLEQYKHLIAGKNVVCVVSGASVDLSRFDEFKELSLLDQGIKYYFLIQMPYKQGILKQFVLNCLGPHDEITHIQFQQKLTRERGPAIVGIEVAAKDNIHAIIHNMTQMRLKFEHIHPSQQLYDLLI